MVTSVSNSLLAAQLYGNAAQQGGARIDAQPRRTEFRDAAKEAGALGISQDNSRNFPIDQIEVSNAVDDAQAQTFEAQDGDTDDVQRFAREAPGTGVTRIMPPGSQLDIRV